MSQKKEKPGTAPTVSGPEFTQSGKGLPMNEAVDTTSQQQLKGSDASVVSAMRDLEGDLLDLERMIQIMADMVFKTFDEDPDPSDDECDLALFTVNDVHKRVQNLKAKYNAAWHGEAN